MTISEVLELHPDGDTLLILRHSGTTIAEDRFEDYQPNALTNGQTEASETDEYDVTSNISTQDALELGSVHSSLVQAELEPETLRFKLSSAVLVDTSTYFKKALSERWRNKEPEPGYKWTLEETYRYGEEFTLLMRILHHKTRTVPRKIDLEMLAKFAVLVDYYGIHEGVEPWPETWISNLSFGPIETRHSRALLLKMMISWVFQSRSRFRDATMVAIRTSTRPIDVLGLPIPEAVVNAIENVRITTICRLITTIQRYQDTLNTHGIRLYGRHCLFMQLGYIDQSLYEANLKPLPSEPYHGFSLEGLRESFDDIDKTTKCSCWSWSLSVNHLQDLRCRLQMDMKNVFRASQDGIGISQFEDN